MKDRSGIAKFWFGIWILKAARECMAKGRCHPYAGEVSEMHLLLKCPEIQRWGGELLSRKWHGIIEEVATGKVLTDKNVIELRGNIACNTKCK